MQPEVYPIPGYPGYFTTDDGRIWSARRWRGSRGRWLATSLDKGYLRVNVYRDGVRRAIPIHRLVLLAFDGPPRPGQMCRHLDGNRQNNRRHNLCWGTMKENGADTIRHGTAPSGDRHWTRWHPQRAARGERNGTHTHPERVCRGENCPQAKLSETRVRTIRALRADGLSFRALAARFGVSTRTIQRVVYGTGWRHVD